MNRVRENVNDTEVIVGNGTSAVVEVPSRTCPWSTEVVVVGPGVRLRMDAADPVWGWLSLGVACLDAAAEELWPSWADAGPDVDDAVCEARAAELRAAVTSAMMALLSTNVMVLRRRAARRRWWR